jgi:uncharacterized protein YraI
MTHSARLAHWLGALLFTVSVAATAQDAFTTQTVNVRAGPDTSYPAVAVLGGGAPVQVMGCLDDWSWCDVVFGDNRGWVYSPYLSYVYQGYRVPFYSYAPAFGIPIISFSLGSYWDRYYRGRPWYGRRDYWEHRQPVHARPSGPPPRASLPSRFHEGRFPENRDNRNYRDYRGNDGNRNRDGNRPGDYRGNDGNRNRDGNRLPASRGESPRPYAGPQGAPRTANTPMQAVERARGGGEHRAGPPVRGGEQRAAPPQPRGGGEQRVERSKEGKERKGPEGSAKP